MKTPRRRTLGHGLGLRKGSESVLGMNQRNLHFIYPHNPRSSFPIADRKLLTKKLMEAAGVAVPRTFRVYSQFYELRALRQDLEGMSEFVIKPSQGSGGGGIIVIAGRDGGAWRSIGGRLWSFERLRKHIADILFGVYCYGGDDEAIIEERVVQHEAMNRLSPLGLADVRLIVFRGRPVLAMSRIPTRRSDGRANLHQGAVGVGIEMPTGTTSSASLAGRPVVEHPDTGAPLVGASIPCWNEILSLGRQTAAAVPLKYIGVDIVVSASGPLLLEINARPGLEIQNANLTGLRALLNREAGEEELNA